MKRLLFSFALLSTLLAATSCKEILNALIFDVPTGTFVTSTSEGDMYIHFKVLGTCDIYFEGEESKSQEGNCFVLDNVLTITQNTPLETIKGGRKVEWRLYDDSQSKNYPMTSKDAFTVFAKRQAYREETGVTKDGPETIVRLDFRRIR